MPNWYHWEGDDLIVRLRVQPRASRDEFAEVQGDYRRIRITAPPVEGKANAYLCQWLAAAFQVPATRISLLAGAASRTKRFRIGAPRRLPAGIEPPAAEGTIAPG